MSDFRDSDQKLYILLSHTGTVLTSLIKVYTKSPYNHVSFGFDKSLKELYSFGRYWARNPFFGGFIRENIKEGIYKIKPNTTCCVYEVDITEESYKKLNHLISDYEKKRLLHRFSFLGLLTILFNKPFRRKYKRFCAEFVAEALEVSGIHDTGKHWSLSKPGDFHNIMNSKKIFEGKLINYVPEVYNK